MAVKTECFGVNAKGEPITRYIIENARGAYAALINQGAHIQRIVVPDARGVMGDVCLGFDEAAPYVNTVGSIGSTVGRVANRISGAAFEMDGERYTLFANEGENTLHGGREGFHKKWWAHEACGDQAVRFTYVSPDGEEGFPGEMTLRVTFTFDDACALRIDYEATCTRHTPLNLTNHAYFNLNGGGTVHDHVLRINADFITDVDGALIPTGALVPVRGTLMDFSAARPLRDGLDHQAECHYLLGALGYDANYVLRGAHGDLCEAAEAYAPQSGRFMRVYTDQPGVQLYTGNHLNTDGRGGHMGPYTGFCLETQHFPDSVHQPDFPDATLAPGETFTSSTIYAFGTR